MQSNNFRGFSSNVRYNQNMGNSNAYQGPLFNQRNQNNLFFSNTGNNNNFFQNNNNPIRINPLSSYQMGNSTSPPPRANSQKKRLYVRLTQEEKGYYSNLFQLVDDQNIGKLKAKEAANFMKKSGLSKDVLKSIWLIASHTSKQFLEKDEFYVALRLIALAQNNMPYNAQAIITNNPLPPLPNFNLKKDFLSDDDTLFEMRDDEKVKYKRFFDINKDGNNDNMTARKAIQMWRSTGADDNIIKKIADILRPNETKGFLNLREFQVATHLINLSNKHEIPTQLPNNLRKYLGRPESNNINIINFNNNGNINNNGNNINNNDNNNGMMRSNNLTNILNNFDFGNNNNNCQQLAIRYENNIFGNNQNQNIFKSGNFNNNNFNNNNNNNNNININNNMNNNNNFNNNMNINNNINQNEFQKTMRELDDLNQKNELLNNQINMAKNKLNNVIREIDDLQNEQQNIRNQINLMKEKCLNMMSNMSMGNNNTNSNLNINNNINNISNKNTNFDNMNNNGNNNINKNNESNYRNKNYYNISLNQSGIGPSKTIIGVNSPQQQSLNDSKKEEYEKLAKKKNDLLDLMNKMQFDKFLVKDNSNTNDNENNNNGFNHNEENKNNNKDILEPEKENTLKNIPSITDTNKNKINANKFDDRLLESQAFEPEKLEKLAMNEIPNPGIDDFNFGQEPLNPYEEDDNDNNKKKSDLNFGFNSPIDNKHFNFDKNNISLASEIKKIDDDNGYPNIEQENLGNNNEKLKINDSNVFKFEYGEDNNQQPERKQSKDTFNFNTTVNQKEGDEWDF